MDQVAIYPPAAYEIRRPPIPAAGCAFAASALVVRCQIHRFAWVGRPHLSAKHACTRRERIYPRAPSLVVLGAAVAEPAAVMQPMMHGVGSAAPDDTHVMMHWLHGAFVPISSPSTADGSAAFPTLITSAVVHTPVDSARCGLPKEANWIRAFALR